MYILLMYCMDYIFLDHKDILCINSNSGLLAHLVQCQKIHLFRAIIS